MPIIDKLAEPDLRRRLGLIAENWQGVGPGTMRDHALEAKAEIEKLSALWIAETRENEKLRADLASIRSVYDFAALEAKIAELRAENGRIWKALTESVKLQTHYAGLLNQYDGGNRMQFHSTEAWMNRLRDLEQKAGEKKS